MTRREQAAQQYCNQSNLNMTSQSINDPNTTDQNQLAHSSSHMEQPLLSTSSQQPQALTGQGPGSSSPPISTVQPTQAVGGSQAQGSSQAPQANRSFFELAPQSQNVQFQDELARPGDDQHARADDAHVAERVHGNSSRRQSEAAGHGTEQQANFVNNVMNQMQSVIKEGEQAQNELTHYEEELKTFENQYQMIPTDHQQQVREQVDQSVAILNHQIDNKKIQIQSLQDKYNQLQQVILKKQNSNWSHQQQSAFSAPSGQVYPAVGATGTDGMHILQQPQDSSKVQDASHKNHQGAQDFRRNMQQMSQNLMNRGFKTPQTIKESSTSMHNETTPKAHAPCNKVFRSQEVGREPERHVNELGNQQQYVGQLDGNGSFGGMNPASTNQYCVGVNKDQMMQKADHFTSLTQQQNLAGQHGGGSFNSGNVNNAGLDRGAFDGSGGNQQLLLTKPKVIIGQHGAPRLQSAFNQKGPAFPQQNSVRLGATGFQPAQSQHQSHVQGSADFNQLQAQQLLNAQAAQLLNSMTAQNNSAQRFSSQHNSAQRHGSISSNHSGGAGLLPGSQQRLTESQFPADMQQLLSQGLQSAKTGAPLQLQLGDQQLGKQQSQSAQRAQELDAASRLVQSLQGLYSLGDRELEQALAAIGHQQPVNQQQEQLGRKLIEQLTIQATAKLSQIRERNGPSGNSQEQYQELQRLFQRRAAAQGSAPLSLPTQGTMQMQGQGQNRVMTSHSQQWSTIQEQASILSKKLIQQNSAAIMRSASRMQEQQQYNHSAGGGQHHNNSAFSGQAMQGGSSSSQNAAGQVQHFQLADTSNVLKQPSNFSMSLHNQDAALSSAAGVGGHQIDTDQMMNIDSLQQNVIAQKNAIADMSQISDISKGQQRSGKLSGGGGSAAGSKGKDAGQVSSGLENVIRFKDREYQFYGKGIISDEQAMEIFDKLLKEQKDPTQSLRTLTQWKDDETHLFQYGLFAFMVKNSKFVEDFDDNDWEQIAEIVPTKDARKCHKRWLFIQKLGGNKTKWTAQEDEILRQLIVDHGAKDWTSISEKLNDALLELIQNASSDDRDKMVLTARNGKQCRERWLTALDPSIKKSQWTLKEDQEFLEQWLKLGNKWREIANIIEGRTESQVKNRFKLILRREHIQQTKIDPDELRSVIIPRILESIKQQILNGVEIQNPKSQSAVRNAEEENAEDSDGSGPRSKKRIKEQSQQDNIMNRLEQIDAQRKGPASQNIDEDDEMN